MDSSLYHGHFRSRTTSSNIFPIQSPTPLHLSQQSPDTYDSPSLNTFATVSSSGSYPLPPAAFRVSPSADLRRSTSSRSGGASPQSGGYVNALRKQKATVWCDRFQDPIRAYFDVSQGKRNSGGGGYVSSSAAAGRTYSATASSKVTSKIRHQGRMPLQDFTPGENHVGVGGVPLRLSATEVEGESSDDEPNTSRVHHRRGSSGRSSSASTRRAAPYRPGQPGRRLSPGDTPERTGSLVEVQAEEVISEASPAVIAAVAAASDDAASGRAESTGSGSFGERADSVGELGNASRLASNSLLNSNVVKDRRTVEDLRRRGSVDERTMTLMAGRLYIANPD